MKQKFVGNILVTALLLCLFMTGSAFATNYAYVLVPNDDVIKVYNYKSNSLYGIIDLDGGSYTYDEESSSTLREPFATTNPSYAPNATQTFGTIAAMEVGPQERYLYIVSDNGAATAGKLYQLDITGNSTDKIEPFNVITELAQVGIRPKAIAVDSVTNFVFVANYGDNTVTKYTKSTGTVIQLTGFYKPIALAVTSGNISRGSDLYVANFEPQSEKYYVSMYNAFIKMDIEVTNRPTDIVTTLDNEYVYVCNSSDTAGLISVIKPVDYLDVESDGDPIFAAGENTVVDRISIADAKPTRMALVELENRIYTIDPVFGETADDLTITFGTGTMSVIDCSGRENETIDPDDENEAHIFSRNVTPTITPYGDPAITDYSGGISIAGTRNGTSVFTVTGVVDEHSFFQTDI